jgi:hypothetical protein
VAKATSALNTSFVVAAEVRACQLLFVRSEPVPKISLLPPAMDRLLRRTWGVLLVPWLR